MLASKLLLFNKIKTIQYINIAYLLLYLGIFLRIWIMVNTIHWTKIKLVTFKSIKGDVMVEY